MKALHISAECYPAAKAGGLGDVVGALPKYLNRAGMPAGVAIPKYRLRWIQEHNFHVIYKGAVRLHNYYTPFTIQQERNNTLGFPLFVVDIPGRFDRDGIYATPGGYGYDDDVERYLSFQQAILQWIANSPGRPQLLHCHDHHTGLIPFLVKYCPDYKALRHIPTAFTIHNGLYQGAFSWSKYYLMPFFEAGARGLLDWNDAINPMATAIKCAWRVTTVSPNYLKELQHQSNGLEPLLQHEQHKCLGILNGIDTQVWAPDADPFLANRLNGDMEAFKQANRQALSQRFQLNPSLPLITFIGRLVDEKGAGMLPGLISRALQNGMQAAFTVLGTGDPNIQNALRQLAYQYPGRFDAALEYNEGLAHQLYAGSDFILMPSRIEPCGLNQMYAMRYGTVPIVRAVGGLADTVPDVGEPDGKGRGIRFTHFNLDDAYLALYRAVQLHQNPQVFNELRQRIAGLDFSWEQAALAYIDMYNQML
ncbi:MAG: glycogen synthase [Phaeodactylibacter sp.]|nr:glycogen synthase [Phaeodactylibacter sp.]MCB9275198.1 glycogen synthase [Lewinellaceae bacterium]